MGSEFFFECESDPVIVVIGIINYYLKKGSNKVVAMP
jgi:hypothetical protein